MKCEICGSSFKNSNGSIFFVDNSKKIGICPTCHEDVSLPSLWFNIDIMIVQVSETSFKLGVNEKKYIRPSRHLTKRPKFIAFYRGGEIGAITHIAKVINILNS